MKFYSAYSVLIALLLFSCLSKKQEAEKYMERYQFRIEMFTTGTENFLKESYRITSHRVKSAPDLESQRRDSLKIADLLQGYKIITGTARTHLEGLMEFEEFDLKKSGIKFIDEYSSMVNGPFYNALFDFRPNMTEAELDQTVQNLKAIQSNLKKLDVAHQTLQRRFLNQFGIPQR